MFFWSLVSYFKFIIVSFSIVLMATVVLSAPANRLRGKDKKGAINGDSSTQKDGSLSYHEYTEIFQEKGTFNSKNK